MDNYNLSEIKLDSRYEGICKKRIYETSKRIFDIISSLVGIIVLSPIILLVAISVKLDSEGPVVFGHTRLGKNKKTIKVYKFRTMKKNSKEIFDSFTDAQKEEYYINFKLDNDPRITKVGNILRKTSLDELPQLINILKGDMSVVGPRPIVEGEIEKYGAFADKLFTVVPGLTGYWQANGRSDTTYDERVKMDMQYIDKRTFLMDIKLILKTVISVSKKEGAV